MSRLVIACSLVLALSSQIAAAQSFAQPPPGAPSHSERMPMPALDRDAIRARLSENRTANLARFHAYRLAGVYPSNTHQPGLANVWRDEAGHFCAAATIIRASGETALVDSVADQDNFIRLADVTQGPVMDWILTSGFTQAELALIQRPFMPVTERPQIAPVHPVVVDAKLRAAETQRLAKLYREIEAKLIADRRASLEVAVDRLMNSPLVAQKLLGMIDG